VSRITWRLPEELIEIGFQRSRVVILNEAQDGLRRSIRARHIGRQILRSAYLAGARHLALHNMDQMFAAYANGAHILPIIEAPGALSQPEMRDMLQLAVDMGFTLLPISTDWNAFLEAGGPVRKWQHDVMQFSSRFLGKRTAARLTGFDAQINDPNWEDAELAENLTHLITELDAARPNEEVKLLVWCNFPHNTRLPIGDWQPMAWRFNQMTGIRPFCIDQTRTILFPGSEDEAGALVVHYREPLEQSGGTAGFLAEEGPAHLRNGESSLFDAYLFSLDNMLE
jgi:hypothetical protein